MSVTVEPKTIRGFREELGWSRRRLAAILGVSVETLRSYESGRRVCSGPAAILLTLTMTVWEPVINQKEDEDND